MIDGDELISKEGMHLLEKLFQSSGEGIMLFNTKGEVVLANPRSQKMFGYEVNELIGHQVGKLVPSAIAERHKTYHNEYIQNPQSRPMGEGRDLSARKKDGTTFPVEISLSYIEHNNEKLVVAFVTDISIRKSNEQKLEQQRKELEQYTHELELKVKERTSKLEHMNLGLQSQIQERKLAEAALKHSLEDLKKAEQEILKSLEKEKELNELKSRFVSMASHEFRTPLTTILSSSNLIAKYTEADQQEKREKHVDRIRKNVENLISILNDFLSLEKLESGLQQTNVTEVDMPAFLQELIEEMNLILKKGQYIKIQGNASPIQTDEHILKNILINLISNASKYSEENSPIYLVLEHSESQLYIHVKDQGIGIPQEEQKNLFGRFFRAGNAANIKGTGLGLHIVNKYIHILEGKISFESAEGEGSTFSITLPA